MISVVIGNNISRETIVIAATATLKEAFDAAGIEYAGGLTHLDGTPVPAGGLNKTFADYGVTDKCYLLSVVKSENA